MRGAAPSPAPDLVFVVARRAGARRQISFEDEPTPFATYAPAGDAALVVFNTADRATLLDNLDTGLPAGTVLRGAFAIDAPVHELVVGVGGRVTLPLAVSLAPFSTLTL